MIVFACTCSVIESHRLDQWLLVVLVHHLSTFSIVFLNFLSRNGFLLISGGSTMS